MPHKMDLSFALNSVVKELIKSRELNWYIDQKKSSSAAKTLFMKFVKKVDL
jgi:hypothetical protein